jgi:hypothetical protein
MIYNTKNKIESIKANERLQWLTKNEKRIEIKELRGKRTTPQNAYLHLVLNYFALEYGETFEFTKQDIFKKWVNPEIFKTTRKNPKNGKTRDEWRSSADLDTKEMTDAIDRFKNWSVQKTGIKLPEANEQEFLDHIQNEIDKNKQWL